MMMVVLVVRDCNGVNGDGGKNDGDGRRDGGSNDIGVGNDDDDFVRYFSAVFIPPCHSLTLQASARAKPLPNKITIFQGNFWDTVFQLSSAGGGLVTNFQEKQWERQFVEPR